MPSPTPRIAPIPAAAARPAAPQRAAQRPDFMHALRHASESPAQREGIAGTDAGPPARAADADLARRARGREVGNGRPDPKPAVAPESKRTQVEDDAPSAASAPIRSTYA